MYITSTNIDFLNSQNRELSVLLVLFNSINNASKTCNH